MGYDQIEGSPQNTVRRIWRQMASLNPGNRNGIRITIDTVREEIRAVRSKGAWISKTSVISRDAIIDEIKKNSDEPANMHIVASKFTPGGI